MGEKVQFGTTVEPEVLERVKALAKAEGVSQGDLVERMLDAYSAEPVFAEDVKGEGGVTIDIPRSRDDLARAFITVIEASKQFKAAAKGRKGPSIYEGEEYQIEGNLP